MAVSNWLINFHRRTAILKTHVKKDAITGCVCVRACERACVLAYDFSCNMRTVFFFFHWSKSSRYMRISHTRTHSAELLYSWAANPHSRTKVLIFVWRGDSWGVYTYMCAFPFSWSHVWVIPAVSMENFTNLSRALAKKHPNTSHIQHAQTPKQVTQSDRPARCWWV